MIWVMLLRGRSPCVRHAEAGGAEVRQAGSVPRVWHPQLVRHVLPGSEVLDGREIHVLAGAAENRFHEKGWRERVVPTQHGAVVRHVLRFQVARLADQDRAAVAADAAAHFGESVALAVAPEDLIVVAQAMVDAESERVVAPVVVAGAVVVRRNHRVHVGHGGQRRAVPQPLGRRVAPAEGNQVVRKGLPLPGEPSWFGGRTAWFAVRPRSPGRCNRPRAWRRWACWRRSGGGGIEPVRLPCREEEAAVLPVVQAGQDQRASGGEPEFVADQLGRLGVELLAAPRDAEAVIPGGFEGRAVKLVGAAARGEDGGGGTVELRAGAVGLHADFVHRIDARRPEGDGVPFPVGERRAILEELRGALADAVHQGPVAAVLRAGRGHVDQVLDVPAAQRQLLHALPLQHGAQGRGRGGYQGRDVCRPR